MNLRDAISEAPSMGFNELFKDLKDGVILEFGVAGGATTRNIATLNPTRKVYGFDSFKGLPEEWNGMVVGQFACELPKDFPSNVELVIGTFQDTLPIFLGCHSNEPISSIHIDCDLYSSTKFVLDTLKDKVQNGLIILFDEIVGSKAAYPTWEEHEYRAFDEFINETGYRWECFANYGPHQRGFKIYR